MATVREDFVAFINQGNLVQLAIAFVIGAAFSAVVTALVTDLFTPLIGVAGHIDFSAWVYTLNGSTFFQGLFLNALIAFVTVVLVVFFAIALPYQRHKDKVAAAAAAAPPTTRACPECLSQIPIAAHRCSFCTSVVPPVAPATPAAKPAAN
jgi:large conductance mechanosensitive channel